MGIRGSKVRGAIEHNRLSFFLMGLGDYRCHGRSDHDDPNDYAACWEQEIIPYALTASDLAFPQKLTNALAELISYRDDPALAIYTFNAILFNYYFALRRDRNSPFTLDLSNLAGPAKTWIENSKALLIKDKRWAGAEWNSKQGLWEPVVRSAVSIRDDYNGIDYVPASAASTNK